VIVYAIIDSGSSRNNHSAMIETFIRREDGERFIEDGVATVPSSLLRIEERELEAWLGWGITWSSAPRARRPSR
jgi:hypothetical protein